MKNVTKNKTKQTQTAPVTLEVSDSAPTETAESSLAPVVTSPPDEVELSPAEEIARMAVAPTMELILEAALKGVEFWMGHGFSMEDAFDRVHGGNFGSPREIAGSKPLASFDWDDMRRIEQAKAGSADKMRELMKRQARAEIKDGRRGARAVAHGTLTPMDEARYVALVEELNEDWKPRGGIERTMIEQMAQAHLQYLHWQSCLNDISASMAWEEPKRTSGSGKEPWLARVTQAEAANQAANMADRSQRMFLRTQRALRDLRRHSITIERVDQLNMGEQQVNISAVK